MAIPQRADGGPDRPRARVERGHVLCLVSRPAVAVQVKLIIRPALYRPRG